MRARTAAAGLLALALSGCDVAGCRVNDMVEQPRQDTYEVSPLFADGAAARPLVPGTVPRNAPEALPAVIAVDRAMLERGRDRFAVFCTPCHDLAGTGDGMIVRRGYPAPPSFHSERLRQMPDADVLAVIRDGRGKMPPYGPRVGPWDRAAVVAWIRVLQRSRAGTLDDLEPADRERLRPDDGSSR